MKNNPVFAAALSAAISLTLALPMSAHAQSSANASYPTKPIKIVVPAPAGSANDILVRTVADKLSQRLGQPMVIDNRPGAGAILGTEVVARAAPDGYTLLSANVVHIINSSIKDKLPYHALRDFTPISLIGYTPSVLLANTSVGISTIGQLLDAARKSVDGITYATAGGGTAGNLVGELFKQASGARLVHVPYKGITQGITDTLGGHVSLVALFGPDAIPLVKSKRLIPLAIASTKRSPLLPDTPTFAELGFPTVELVAWYGFLGPAKMPKAITNRLNQELREVLAAPELKQKLADLLFEASSSSSQELETLMTRDLDRLSRIAQTAGLKEN